MAIYSLAVILNSPLNDSEFLLVKQARPPKFSEEEYNFYVDSDLWDLPSTRLNRVQGERGSGFFVEWAKSCSENLDLTGFDVEAALNRVLVQMGSAWSDLGGWRIVKHVEEPEFGPGLPAHFIFVMGKLVAGYQKLTEPCMWASTQTCLNWLLEAKPSSDRVGHLAVLGLENDSMKSIQQKIPTILRCQEYPPGIMLVPMRSRTQKPFKTTNLVIVSPENVSQDHGDCDFIAHGDALLVDPGCQRGLHKELRKIVAALPKKLLVLVTHHHRDHIDGLSAVQKCNPNATLLAHENTIHRIGRDSWSLPYISVSGAEDICVGGQRLTVIFAPGHTDGHVALLHVRTNSLIVGDHCLGQGSALLDVTAGGNMAEYFQSTYKLMGLSPHILIPMHGRVNLWPKHLLCSYLKNRRDRESAILKAIESGAKTLFDIVSSVYSEVDRSLWIPAASNVRLHVDHLAQQDKLPKEFMIHEFQTTCGARFLFRWTLAYARSRFQLQYHKLGRLTRVQAVFGGWVLLAAHMIRYSNGRRLDKISNVNMDFSSSPM